MILVNRITNKDLLIALILSCIAILLMNHLWLVIILLSFLFLLKIIPNKTLFVPVSLVVFLVVTSDISEDLRVSINIFGFMVLLYLFIKDYGINFHSYPKIPKIVETFILVIIANMLISSFFSAYPVIGLTELLRQIVFFALVYLFYSFIKGEKEIINFLLMLIVSGSLISVTICYSFLQNTDIYLLISTRVIQEGGYIKNVAAAGGILAISISVNLSFLFFERMKRAKYYRFLFLSFLLQVIGLLLTNSRAAFLAVFVSCFYILYKLRRQILKRIISYFVLITTLILIIFPKVIDVLAIFLRFERVMENVRYYLWDISISIFGENLIFGVGPGAFKFYIYKYIPVLLGTWEEQSISFIYEKAGAGHSHNFWLYKASELGIFGLIGVFFLPVLIIVIVNRLMKVLRKNSDYYIIIVAITGSFLGLIYRSMFESTGILTNGWITRDLPFWIILSIVIFLYHQLIEKKKDEKTFSTISSL